MQSCEKILSIIFIESHDYKHCYGMPHARTWGQNYAKRELLGLEGGLLGLKGAILRTLLKSAASGHLCLPAPTLLNNKA